MTEVGPAWETALVDVFDGHQQRCAPNLLLDQPLLTQATRLWVSDITYLPLANG